MHSSTQGRLPDTPRHYSAPHTCASKAGGVGSVEEVQLEGQHRQRLQFWSLDHGSRAHRPREPSSGKGGMAPDASLPLARAPTASDNWAAGALRPGALSLQLAAEPPTALMPHPPPAVGEPRSLRILDKAEAHMTRVPPPGRPPPPAVAEHVTQGIPDETTILVPQAVKSVTPETARHHNPRGTSSVTNALGDSSDTDITESVQFSRSIVSDSSRPHGLQHARLPCPSPTPRVYPNSCPSSRWCHPTSVVCFSSCLQSFPASGSFQMSQFFAPGGQSIGVAA